MTTTPARLEHRQVDLPLGPGRRTLRLLLTYDQAGAPDTLMILDGFGGAHTDTPFHRPGWVDGPLQLPASVLPELVRALEQLVG
jgi:hypothetical protein